MSKPSHFSIVHFCLLAAVAGCFGIHARALAGQVAQDAPEEQPPVQIDPVTGRPAIEPRPVSPTESAQEAAARMYLGGESLLQAQQAVSQRPQAAGIDNRISFFAVPTPEPVVIRRHDLVTVIVREESATRSQGQTDLRKQAQIDAILRDYVRLQLDPIALEPASAGHRLNASAEQRYRADGRVDRNDSFLTRITAEVVDVKPNGTLVLQARKRIKTDEEEQSFILTGICRTQDITADNTILSTQLHDLELEKHTSGAVRDATRRGFISRMLGRINPF